MPLHGNICINDNVIGQWWAGRLDDLVDTDQISKYQTFLVIDGHETSRIIEHRYSDGATELIRKIMTRED